MSGEGEVGTLNKPSEHLVMAMDFIRWDVDKTGDGKGRGIQQEWGKNDIQCRGCLVRRPVQAAPGLVEQLETCRSYLAHCRMTNVSEYVSRCTANTHRLGVTSFLIIDSACPAPRCG